MWRMSNGQAVIFIALIVIAVALMHMLLALIVDGQRARGVK